SPLCSRTPAGRQQTPSWSPVASGSSSEVPKSCPSHASSNRKKIRATIGASPLLSSSGLRVRQGCLARNPIKSKLVPFLRDRGNQLPHRQRKVPVALHVQKTGVDERGQTLHRILQKLLLRESDGLFLSRRRGCCES